MISLGSGCIYICFDSIKDRLSFFVISGEQFVEWHPFDKSFDGMDPCYETVEISRIFFWIVETFDRVCVPLSLSLSPR